MKLTKPAIEMTLQETFDFVANHLLRQGCRSMLEEDLESGVMITCAYRGSEGRMCAVGCLIPDDLYTIDMEGSGVSSKGYFSLLFRFDQVNLLSALQNKHDYDKMDLKNLQEVAKDYGLSDKNLKAP